MKTETTSISWTWADQISSYRFWGIFLFAFFLLIPNFIINLSISSFSDYYGMPVSRVGTAMGIKSLAGFGGLWLAWFMVRMKNHYLLYLFAGFTIIGILLILVLHSVLILFIGFFLIGLGFGAVTLAIPTLIAGGKGGSEMFVVSFGLITFYEWVTRSSISGLFTFTRGFYEMPNTLLIISLAISIVGTLILLPVKADLFHVPPQVRKKSFTPRHRDPVVVALLCLIPFYNIYYVLHIMYRFHGEVNKLNPTPKILSPRGAVWCTLLLSVLSPIIVASLNTGLIARIRENNAQRYYRNWVVILWSFIFVPVSYALIQSNLNRLTDASPTNNNA